MKAIHLPTLRRHLFVNDRLPDTNMPTYYKNIPLYASWGDRKKPECYRDIVLWHTDIKYDRVGCRRKSSNHRLLAECPCGRLIPVGRLAQHKCKHNK